MRDYWDAVHATPEGRSQAADFDHEGVYVTLDIFEAYFFCHPYDRFEGLDEDAREKWRLAPTLTEQVMRRIADPFRFGEVFVISRLFAYWRQDEDAPGCYTEQQQLLELIDAILAGELEMYCVRDGETCFEAWDRANDEADRREQDAQHPGRHDKTAAPETESSPLWAATNNGQRTSEGPLLRQFMVAGGHDDTLPPSIHYPDIPLARLNDNNINCAALVTQGRHATLDTLLDSLTRSNPFQPRTWPQFLEEQKQNLESFFDQHGLSQVAQYAYIARLALIGHGIAMARPVLRLGDDAAERAYQFHGFGSGSEEQRLVSYHSYLIASVKEESVKEFATRFTTFVQTGAGAYLAQSPPPADGRQWIAVQLYKSDHSYHFSLSGLVAGQMRQISKDGVMDAELFDTKAALIEAARSGSGPQPHPERYFLLADLWVDRNLWWPQPTAEQGEQP